MLDGQVTVRYNHYKPSLAVTGGRLAASVIDEELYLSGVFKKWCVASQALQWMREMTCVL